MSRHINLTPSWEEAMRMCLVLVENATTEEAKQAGREEILRCGRLLDLANKRAKE